MQEVVDKIKLILSQKKTTLKAMQSLIGSLNFCCRAIVVGRSFCRRLINSTCGIKYSSFRISMVFRCFTIVTRTNADIQLFTDSSGGIGFGIWFDGHWCQER